MKNSRKLLALLALLASLPWSAQAQRIIEKDTKWTWKNRLYYGGGLDIGGGSGYFNIGLNPTVGYMLTSRVSVGTNALWQYITYTDTKFDAHLFGLNFFTRYNILKFLFAYGEIGFINTPAYIDDRSRVTLLRVPLGLGYSQYLGERGVFNVMVLYDVAYNRTRHGSVYNSPWVFRLNFVY